MKGVILEFPLGHAVSNVQAINKSPHSRVRIQPAMLNI
jgi:hypothetical protein